MASPTVNPSVTAPKTHPLVVGGGYGLAAAAVQVLVILLNRNTLHNNGILGFVGSFLLPLIGLGLAGHYAGRHQRLNNLKTTVTSGVSATFAGTGAGFATGLVYVVLTEVATIFTNTGFGNGVISAFTNTVGVILWPILGAFLGTIGGALGDAAAHKQLKSGK